MPDFWRERLRVNRFIQTTLSGVLLLLLHGCVSVPDHTEMTVCDNTPESPAKRACVKSLLPSVRNTIYGFATIDSTYWSDHYLAWSDYLGVHDADYARIEEIRTTIQRGFPVRQQNSNSPDAGYFALAGYYDALGPKWRMYSNEARKVGEFCISNSNCHH